MESYRSQLLTGATDDHKDDLDDDDDHYHHDDDHNADNVDWDDYFLI